MTNYYLTAKLKDGRSITLFEKESFFDATDTMSNLMIHLSKVDFFPLSAKHPAWFVNRDHILEVQIQDDKGRVVLHPLDGETDED